MDVFRKALRYFRKFLPLMIIMTLLGMTAAGLYLLMPQAIQLILDACITPALGKPIPESSSIFGFVVAKTDNILTRLLILVGIYLLLAGARHLIHYTRWTSTHATSVEGEKAMRLAAFKKMLRQNTVVLNRYTSGELMSITNSDPIMVKEMFQSYLPFIFEQSFNIILAAIFLMNINPYLAIAPFACGLTMAVVSGFYMNAMRKVYSRVRATSVDLNTCIQENINGVRIVRAFASESQEMGKFDRRNGDYRDAFLTHAKVWSKYQAIFQSLSQVNSIIGTALAAVFCMGRVISVGEFATCTTYVFCIANPMLNIANWLSQLQQAIVCGQRMFTFIETNNIIKNIAQPIAITAKPNLVMRDMSLTIDGQSILNNITLDLPYGKKLGIMGRSGSGKSALLKAMSRSFEATGGDIRINGTNLKHLDLEDVRRQFGWVMQDVFLFSNTVDANIAFYDPDAPQEEVERCARIAQADGFIHKLSEGYSTIVGERGLGLSGGQKQRISLARALLKDAPILVLDDATSALDLETEQKILAALKLDYADITVAISAHRASSVEWCDEIIYLEDGNIVERGTHAQLMALNGRYHDVWTAQKIASAEVTV